MAVFYKIEPTINLLYFVGFGLCTSGELLQAERTAFNDPLRTTDMKIILDVRYAELDVAVEDMRTLIDINKQLIKSGRKPEKTAVISFNKYVNILEDTFHLLADGLPLKTNIFNHLTDALKWLELSNEEAEVERILKSILLEHKQA